MAVSPFREGFSPFRDLRRIRDEMDRLLGSTLGAGGGGAGEAVGWAPATDVVEQPEEFEVTVELPGMRREDVHVELQDRQLTVRGEKREERERRDERRHLIERSYGSFTRSLTLPRSVDPDRIDARFEDGVLRVRLPKSEAGQGRRIRIEGTEA
ncbi:MAG: Hsp20/alpha crystallin family protein [Gemmatimonadota bacterium]